MSCISTTKVVPARSLHRTSRIDSFAPTTRGSCSLGRYSMETMAASPRALEQVVEQAAEDVRVRREDAPEDEVVLQVGEGHGLVLPARGWEESRAPRVKTQRSRPRCWVPRDRSWDWKEGTLLSGRPYRDRAILLFYFAVIVEPKSGECGHPVHEKRVSPISSTLR